MAKKLGASRIDIIGQNGNEGLHYSKGTRLKGMSEGDYDKLKATGMLYEIFWEATGNWYDDCCR